MGISSSGSNPFINPENRIPSDQTHHELKTGKWSEDKDLGANNNPLVESHSDGSITLNASSSKSALSFEELKDLHPGEVIHFTYTVTPAPTDEAPVFAFLKYNDGDQSDSTPLDAKGEVTLKVPEDYNPNRPLMMGLHSPKNSSNQAYTLSNTSFTLNSAVSSNQTEKWVSSILNSNQPAVLSSLKAIDSEVSQIKGLISNFASINQKYESSLESFKKTGSDSDKKKSDKAFEQLKGSHEEIRQRTGNLINVVSSNITPDVAKQAIGSTDPSFEGKVSEMTDIWHNLSSNYATQISTEEKVSGVPDFLSIKSGTLKDSSPISQWAQIIEGNTEIMHQLTVFSKTECGISNLREDLENYTSLNSAYNANPSKAGYNSASAAWNTFQSDLKTVKADISGFSSDLQNQLAQIVSASVAGDILGQTITPTQASQIQAQMLFDLTCQLGHFETALGYNPSTFPTTGPTPFTSDSPISKQAKKIEQNSEIMSQLSSGAPDSLPVKSSNLRDSSPISQWAHQIENSDLVNQMPNYKNAKNFIDALKSTLDSYNQANAAYQQDPTEATYNAALNAWDAFQGYVTGVKNDITGLPIQISQVITSQAIQSIIGQSVTPDQLSQIQSQIVSDFDNEMASYESSQGVSPSSLPTTGPVPFSPISQWAQQIENSDLVNQMPNYKNAKNFIDALKSTLDSYNQANAAYQQDPTEATYNAALNAWNAFQGYVTGVKNDITGLPIQISQVITSQAIQSIIGQSVTPDQLSQIQSQIQSDFDNEMASYESSQGVSPSSLPTTGPTPYTPVSPISQWAQQIENSDLINQMPNYKNAKNFIDALKSTLDSYNQANAAYQKNPSQATYNAALNAWDAFQGYVTGVKNDITGLPIQISQVITSQAIERIIGQSVTPDQVSQIQSKIQSDFDNEMASYESSQGVSPSSLPTTGPTPYDNVAGWIKDLNNSTDSNVQTAMKTVNSLLALILTVGSDYSSYQAALNVYNDSPKSASDWQTLDNVFQKLKSDFNTLQPQLGSLSSTIQGAITEQIAIKAIASLDPTFTGSNAQMQEIWNALSGEVSQQEQTAGIPSSLPVEPLKPTPTPSNAAIQNDVYFDLGRWQSWNFCNGPNNTINQTALDSYLKSYADQLKANGLSQTTLSFAQVCDISNLVSGNFKKCSTSDALYMLAVNFGNNTNINGVPVFNYIVQQLRNDGINVFLSFGGADASIDSWNFGFDQNSSTDLAEKLAQWVANIGLSGIDFDAETGAENIVSTNGAKNLATFFSTLHSDLRQKNIPITWTILGDNTSWGFSNGYFSTIFQQGIPFQDMFDGLNLMLYNGQYYLNAGQTPATCWDLITWIKDMAKNTGLSPAQCAAMLHIGFDAELNYASSGSSCGPLPYNPQDVPPDVKSNGQYGAYIYLQLENQVREAFNDQSLSFGAPFNWDDNSNYDVTINTEGSSTSDFFSNNNFEEDFYNYLNSLKS